MTNKSFSAKNGEADSDGIDFINPLHPKTKNPLERIEDVLDWKGVRRIESLELLVFIDYFSQRIDRKYIKSFEKNKTNNIATGKKIRCRERGGVNAH
jgi:hypothetical protein